MMSKVTLEVQVRRVEKRQSDEFARLLVDSHGIENDVAVNKLTHNPQSCKRLTLHVSLCIPSTFATSSPIFHSP